jgi:hypothetical protein
MLKNFGADCVRSKFTEFCRIITAGDKISLQKARLRKAVRRSFDAAPTQL